MFLTELIGFLLEVLQLLKILIVKFYLGASEIRELNSLGDDILRHWVFCDSGRYAASVEAHKIVLYRWNPLRLFIDVDRIGRDIIIIIYDMAERKAFTYAYIPLASEAIGYYWRGDYLVVIGETTDGTNVKLCLYELDHSKRLAWPRKSRTFAWSLENSYPQKRKISGILSHYDEIRIDERVIQHDVNRNSRIFLVPRSILADYPPKEYVCSLQNEMRVVIDASDRGYIYYSEKPAIIDATLYFHKSIWYPTKRKYVHQLNQYISIDLLKLEDVYGKTTEEIEEFVRIQDEVAIRELVLHSPDDDPSLFHVFGRQYTIMHNHYRFTYTGFEDKSAAIIVYANLKANTVHSIRTMDYPTTICPHPLGFCAVFCTPSKSDEMVEKTKPQLVRDVLYLKGNCSPRSLTAIAVMEVLMSKEFTSDTTNCIKAVLN